jgi:chromosome segregation ATPase
MSVLLYNSFCKCNFDVILIGTEMPLSQNHLQQIRSVISQQITELEETRSSIRLDINNLVLEKQEVKEYRLMGRVNSLNSEIKNAYKHLEATTAKINKLADLQRSVKGFKNELVNGHREYIDI